MTPAAVTPPALFYPIVPDLAWLKRLVPLGIKTVQLRIKYKPAADVAADYPGRSLLPGAWLRSDRERRLAGRIDAGATYVHLGQEDLAAADLPAIRKAGLMLESPPTARRELETALAADPYYVALGPIYETKLKAMKWRHRASTELPPGSGASARCRSWQSAASRRIGPGWRDRGRC